MGAKKNTNVLEGMRCFNSKCKALEPFCIAVTVNVVATDNGVEPEDCANWEWDQNSPCTCESCGKSGVVSDFMIA